MALTNRVDVAAATLTAAVMGAGSVVAAAVLLASEPSGVDQSLTGSAPPIASVSATLPGPPAATRMAARPPAAPGASPLPASRSLTTRSPATRPPAPRTTASASARHGTVRPMAARTAAPPVKVVLDPDRFEVRTVLEPGKRARAVEPPPAPAGSQGMDRNAWRRTTVGG